jgi:hypothetical protein
VDIHADACQLVRAYRRTVMEITAYENISRWSRRSMDLEEVRLSDSTVKSETVVYREVPGGTLVEWTGRIVHAGRWTRLLGPLMGAFFEFDVKRDFKKLARYAAPLDGGSSS